MRVTVAVSVCMGVEGWAAVVVSVVREVAGVGAVVVAVEVRVRIVGERVGSVAVVVVSILFACVGLLLDQFGDYFLI